VLFRRVWSEQVRRWIYRLLNASITRRSIIDAAEDADDPVTEDLAVTILADEEAHRTEFRGFEKEYQDD
jgi:bacterioferritin